MRVAYCLSGFLRSFKRNNFFENMVGQVPGDVFIHTWNEIVPGTALDPSDVVQFYKPASIMIEDQFKYKQSLKLFGYEDYVQNHVCMWKSISSAINMASDYDVVVRFRPDMVVDNTFLQSEISDAFSNKHKIYMGASDDCFHAGILTDNFAFGSKKAMALYSKYYSMAIAYRTSFGSHERALSAYLEDIRELPDGNRLTFECSKLKYTLKRMDGHLINSNQTIDCLSQQWI